MLLLPQTSTSYEWGYLKSLGTSPWLVAAREAQADTSGVDVDISVTAQPDAESRELLLPLNLNLPFFAFC